MNLLTDEVIDWMANYGARHGGISYVVHDAVSQYLDGTLTVPQLNRLCGDLRTTVRLCPQDREYTFRSWKAIRSLFRKL